MYFENLDLVSCSNLCWKCYKGIIYNPNFKATVAIVVHCCIVRRKMPITFHPVCLLWFPCFYPLSPILLKITFLVLHKKLNLVLLHLLMQLRIRQKDQLYSVRGALRSLQQTSVPRYICVHRLSSLVNLNQHVDCMSLISYFKSSQPYLSF